MKTFHESAVDKGDDGIFICGRMSWRVMMYRFLSCSVSNNPESQDGVR